MSRTWKTDPFTIRAARLKAPIYATDDYGQPAPYHSMPLYTGREAKEIWKKLFEGEDLYYDDSNAITTMPILRCSCPMCSGYYYHGNLNKKQRHKRRNENNELVKMVNSPGYSLDEF